MTMASSTTKPTAMVSAISEGCRCCSRADTSRRRCRPAPAARRRWESTVAQKLRRKRKITITTRAMVRTSVNSTSATDASIACERSDTSSTLMAGGHRGRQLRHRRLDRVDDLDDVGAGLAEDQQQLGALAVVPGAGARPLGAVDHLADVAQPHRRAVAVGDDDVAVARGLEQLVVGVERDTTGWAPSMVPLAWLTVAAAIACGCPPARCRARPARPGSARMRTAKSCWPATVTWATPEIAEIFCASTV